jgi:GntR family transcriptional regulator/MocR family aminotransferase
MELFIDADDDRSVTRQLYEQIRDAILTGRLDAGARLLPTRAAAAALGVARSTVTEVYSRLAAEGYIEGRAGGGSFVRPSPAPPHGAPPPAALRPTPRAAALRRYDDAPDAAGRFDLRPGRIDPSLFPATTWRRCLLAGLAHAGDQYGDPAGSRDLRSALAQWVTASRGIAAAPEQIIVTSGAGHAIDLVARVLLDPGDVAAMEEPGYPPVHQLLRAHGADVRGVPVDEHGLVVDAIPAGTRLVYVTPSHQYPLGAVMSRGRRLELLAWARRHDAAIVEDDYDSEFRHTSRPLEPLHRLDHDGRVLYVGTFSKVLSPAMRLGFLVAPDTLVPALVTMRQVVDWSPPAASQRAMAHFLRGGHLGRHLRRTRGTYTERHDRLRRELLDTLPAGYRVLPAQAGLHLAVVGPHTPDDAELERLATTHGVLVGSLRRTYHDDEPRPGLLLGFGALPVTAIGPAVRRLADWIRHGATTTSRCRPGSRGSGGSDS